MPDMNYYTRMEYNIMDYAICATLSEAKKIKEHNKENTTITITRLQKVDCHDAKKKKGTTLKRKKKKNTTKQIRNDEIKRKHENTKENTTKSGLSW